MSFDHRLAHLEDIIQNCERIARYVQGLDRAEFVQDERTHDAVERCLERVCEAAFRLGDDARALMPKQPWSEMRGMGNHLRHGYDELSPEIEWDVIQRDLPGLVADARAALAELERQA